MNEEKTIARKETSPVESIMQSIGEGADLEKLKGILELQLQWEANEARKAYVVAMTEFKSNPPEIFKDKKVSFGQGKTSYSHASLFNVTDKINSELSKHGLSASWTTQQNGEVSVTCKITHIKGHSEETTLSAGADNSGSKNSIQAIGSTITYLQRYTLLALTGLATHDQDDDGQAIGESYITPEQVHTLMDWILDTGTDTDKFCQYMKTSSIEEIPVSKYAQAISALKQKKEQRQPGQEG